MSKIIVLPSGDTSSESQVPSLVEKLRVLSDLRGRPLVSSEIWATAAATKYTSARPTSTRWHDEMFRLRPMRLGQLSRRRRNIASCRRTFHLFSHSPPAGIGLGLAWIGVFLSLQPEP